MAPLSGYTDLPFRRSLRRHGCVYAFTPLVEAGSIVYNNPRVSSIIARGEEENWLGVQLLGSDLERLKTAVKKLAGHSFEVMDFNMGCPVRKVTKRGAGAALGRTPEFAAECVAAIRALSPVPVTGKIRVLDPDDPAPTVRFARLLEAAGCQALTIHGRVWKKVYSGPVAFHVIKAVREAVGMPVIANGGVMDAASAAELRRETGCSRIMVARGAIGNPWVFADIARASLKGVDPSAGQNTTEFSSVQPSNHTTIQPSNLSGGRPAHEDVCAEVVTHIRDMVDFHGEENGVKVGRKIIAAYLTGRGYSRKLRGEVMGLNAWKEVAEFMERVRAAGPSEGFERGNSF